MRGFLPEMVETPGKATTGARPATPSVICAKHASSLIPQHTHTHTHTDTHTNNRAGELQDKKIRKKTPSYPELLENPILTDKVTQMALSHTHTHTHTATYITRYLKTLER